MSSEWKLVPVEPTAEMLSEIHLLESFTGQALTARYKAMLAAAPTPPAVDEGAVALIVRHGPMGSDGSPIFVRAETLPDAPYDIENLPDGFELVDRAHVTRLQAENAALQQKLTKANLSCHDLAHKLADKWGSVQGAQFETIKALRYLNEELQQRLNTADQRVDDLQSELTEARELLAEALGSVHIDAGKCENTQIFKQTMKLAENIESFLAHQSASAAHGVNCDTGTNCSICGTKQYNSLGGVTCRQGHVGAAAKEGDL